MQLCRSALQRLVRHLGTLLPLTPPRQLRCRAARHAVRGGRRRCRECHRAAPSVCCAARHAIRCRIRVLHAAVRANKRSARVRRSLDLCRPCARAMRPRRARQRRVRVREPQPAARACARVSRRRGVLRLRRPARVRVGGGRPSARSAGRAGRCGRG